MEEYNENILVWPTLVTLTLVLLKLFNIITWSWVWVLSPILIPGLLFVLIMMLMLGLAFFKEW